MIKEYISEDIDEIFRALRETGLEEKLPPPFEYDLLKLLHRANPLEQKYYLLTEGEKYAFFTSYFNRMDLFTYGKLQWFINIQTIGFPCSLSTKGYVTNDEKWMLEYIKTIKGCKLILNADEKTDITGMTFGETLPTCVLELLPEHTSLEKYIKSLRSTYRRRLMQAQKRCRNVTVKRITDDSIDVYPLYLQTYEKSDYKLECLTKEFFDEAPAEKLVFMLGDKPVGFVQLKINGDELVFVFCGMEYGDMEYQGERIENPDLYFFMLMHIVDYAIEKNVKRIDLGQTSENTKMRFGAKLQKKYFYAHHTNKVINKAAQLGRHLLEYRYSFPDYHVFNGE